MPLSPLVPVHLSLEPDGGALLVTPGAALRGGSAYALLLTRGIVDVLGRPLEADDDFRALVGNSEPRAGGPVARYTGDPEAAGNPYPDGRLARPDGTARVPDSFVYRGLVDGPGLTAARGFLRQFADDLETIAGFSTTAPLRVALSAPIDLASVDESTLLLFERDDGALDLSGLMRQAERRGVPPADIVLAVSFPTQPIADDLRTIREGLVARAQRDPFRLILADPDPADDLAVGVFMPGDPRFPAALAGNPDVRAVVVGLIRSPDFRGPEGIFDPAKVDGRTPASDALVDFVLVLPAGPQPHRVVILQHGFAGSNVAMLPLAGALAEEGLASIAISALAHGRRGSPAALLTARPIQVREIFRQTIADQMALVRALESEVDVDGDGEADLACDRFAYLGRSLGSLLGATFVAVEERIGAAVLNVGGGRIAFLGQAPAVRPIYSGFYASAVGLEVGTPDFEIFLERLLQLGQQALDPADPLNFARHWRLDPFPGYGPRRVLLQEGIGDDWVLNENTDALAEAGGLVANRAMQDPAGVAGLWRWEPPGGHSILDRPDVLNQAVRFLASGGTAIVP